MKIAFFTDSFYPASNGVTSSILNFSEELLKRGHKILIFAPNLRGNGLPIENKNIEVVRLPSVKSYIYPDFRIGAPTPRSFWKLRKFNPDIIHVQTSLFVGGEGMISARLLKKPLVYTFHTFFMDQEGLKIFGLNKGRSLMEKSLWKYEKNFCAKAEIVICPTEYVKKTLERQGFKNNLKIIPSGIKIDSLENKANKEELKKRFNLKGKIILGVGRMSKEKNWEFLLSAFSYIVNDLKKNYSLVLIGSGPYQKKLEILTEILEIREKVKFLGEIEHNELIKEGLYSIGDVFAMPSQFETQGLVTLEAMAFGLPVVSLKSKGSTEIVRGVGILETNDEKKFAGTLVRILEDNNLRKKLEENSKGRACDFSIAKLTEELEKTYIKLLRVDGNKLP